MKKTDLPSCTALTTDCWPGLSVALRMVFFSASCLLIRASAACDTRVDDALLPYALRLDVPTRREEELDDEEEDEDEGIGAEYWESERVALCLMTVTAVRCCSTGTWRAFLRENCGVSGTKEALCEEDQGMENDEGCSDIEESAEEADDQLAIKGTADRA